jgi:hypothetical protein
MQFKKNEFFKAAQICQRAPTLDIVWLESKVTDLIITKQYLITVSFVTEVAKKEKK